MTATADGGTSTQLFGRADVGRQLDAGRVLPPAFYTDESIRQLEDRLIFRHAWQMVCAELDVREPGQYVATQIASVPVVVVRDNDRVLRAFVNICTHRAGPIMEESGTCQRMRCGYHGWSFALDGSLTGVPKFAEGNLPPLETLSLRPLPVDTFAGIVFVSLDPQESLAEQVGELAQLMSDAGYDFPFANPDSGLVPIAEHTGAYPAAANWKVVAENFTECYHCGPTHPGTFAAVLEVGKPEFAMTTEGKFGLAAGLPLRESMKSRFVPTVDDYQGSKYGFSQFYIWPNALILTGCIGEHLMRLDPVTARDTNLVYRGYKRPGLPEEEVDALYKLLMYDGGAEDKLIMEAVQRGLESGFYEAGPTMAGPEVVVSAFQRQVWDCVAPGLR
jgi:phenylpropionate dioxygenase-like ring-hydroxylating dioxygenase large terminal subunit